MALSKSAVNGSLVEHISALPPERIALAKSLLIPGDDVATITAKLAAAGFAVAEIESFVSLWVKPE